MVEAIDPLSPDYDCSPFLHLESLTLFPNSKVNLTSPTGQRDLFVFGEKIGQNNIGHIELACFLSWKESFTREELDELLKTFKILNVHLEPLSLADEVFNLFPLLEDLPN